MEQKPIENHYDPQGKMRLLGILVKVLLVVMIIGISIIVAIIVKEFLLSTKQNQPPIITLKELTIPKNSKVESIYVEETQVYLLLTGLDEKQKIVVIRLEDGVEISRDSIILDSADK